MEELQGLYGEAKIFTDLVEDQAIAQVSQLLNQPFAANAHTRIMSDVHAGAGCVIGTTMVVTDKVCPNLVGVDIGCGMLVARLTTKEIDFYELDRVIHQHIPSGFAIRKKAYVPRNMPILENLWCAAECDLDRARHSIGTLGGGNHFIEVNRGEDGHLWLVIHSGSRHLGTQVAKYYQKKAIEQTHEKCPDVPNDLCWCGDELRDHYLDDMQITQEFAAQNRLAMMQIILDEMNLNLDMRFQTIHNYIEYDDSVGLLRKGAVSAKKGERLIIPMNMRDGSLICRGKGNPDWNYSAPHGAGRIMSRKQAREQISLDEFNAAMTGIWSTSISRHTIDEAPMAYKPMESIVENIGDTVEILEVIKPVYNFKA